MKLGRPGNYPGSQSFSKAKQISAQNRTAQKSKVDTEAKARCATAGKRTVIILDDLADEIFDSDSDIQYVG